METVAVGATVAEVAARFRAGGHGAYPLVDGEGRVVGIIARGDLLREPDDATLDSVAVRDVVTVSPGDSVLAALEVMLEETVDHLPVVEDGRLVGICTRTDVLSARRTGLASERPEPGWRPNHLLSTFAGRTGN